MIFGNRDPALGERSAGTVAIEPCRGDETVDAPADHIFEQGPSLHYPARRILERKAKKFAFSSGHEPGTEAVELSMMSRLIAVEIAVKENFCSGSRPGPQTRRERRPRDDRRAAPMIGNDQHREPIADKRFKQINQLIDLALEARRDIMDRC
jgi:hypothetical protein